MKRLARVLFNIAAVLSLILCVASAAFWVRSYWSIDQIIYQPSRDSYDAYVDRGACSLRWIEHNGYAERRWRFYRDSPPPPAYPKMAHPPPESTERRLGGFWYEYGSIMRGPWKTGALSYRAVVLPCWALTVLFLLLPTCALLHRLRARRTLRRTAGGLCPTCGYDMRATPERCPECGWERC